MSEFLADHKNLLTDQKLTIRIRPDLNDHHRGEFNSHLFRTYNHKFLSNIESEIKRLDDKAWDRFSLTLEIDQENVQLLYASMAALDSSSIPLHFFIKVNPDLIKNEEFIKQLKSQFQLLETYISHKPFIYFYCIFKI